MKFTLIGSGTAHIRHVMMSGVYGQRRVASLTYEGDNKLRPRNAGLPPRPYTMDIYFPLLPRQDKVMKFSTEAEALDKLRGLLWLLQADINKEEEL